MRLLRSVSQEILSLIGNQPYDSSETYVESIYNIKVEIDDGILLYNHFSKAIIILKNKEELFPNDLLISNWFYFKSSIDQYKFLNQAFQKYRNSHYSNYLSPSNLVILNTYRCNANCPYCFERNRDHMKNMSEQVALDTAKQICKNINHNFRLQFFGGEPTINIKSIDIITNYLNEHFQYNYYTTMTSNGYLLKDINIGHIQNDQHLQRIDITLDGIGKVYNNIKNYNILEIDAFGSVIRVIENLLLNDIQVRINCNVSPTNYQDMHCVINFATNKFKGLPYEVLVHPLFETDSMKFTQEELDRMMTNYVLLLKELKKQLNQTWNEMDVLEFFNCTADSGNGCSITPDGNIAICENNAEQTIIGNIQENSIQYIEPIIKFREYEELSQCSSCPLNPSCLSLKACNEKLKQCTTDIITFRIMCLKEMIRSWYYKSCIK